MPWQLSCAPARLGEGPGARVGAWGSHIAWRYGLGEARAPHAAPIILDVSR